MTKAPILELIATNREYLMLNSPTAIQNLAMLHKSFDSVDDEQVIMSLALNDSIASMVVHSDYAVAIALSLSMLERFPDSAHGFFVAFHWSVIGRCRTVTGDYPGGRESLLAALEICRGLQVSDETILLIVDVLHDLAMTTDMSGGDPSESAAYLSDAISRLEGTTFAIRKGVCKMGLGNVRYTEGKVEEALACYLAAHQIFEDTYNFTNLGPAVCNVGLCYSDLGRYEEAERYLLRSLEVRLRGGGPGEIANSHFNLAKLYDKRGDATRLKEHLVKCESYLSKNGTGTKLYREVREWLDRVELVDTDRQHA